MRAYLRTGEILVLDEPASALDAKAEAGVYRHLAPMADAQTSILISPARLCSSRFAGRFPVLRDGRLAEEGAHEEFVRAGGTYADLYGMQAARYR